MLNLTSKSENNPLLTKFTWRMWNESFIPVLELKSNFQTYYRVWSDEIFLKLSKLRYCINCLEQLKVSQTQGNLCQNCNTSSYFKRWQCRYQQAGVPFGAPCNTYEPICGDLQFANNLCQQGFILYLAKKEYCWKVGLTRKDRGGLKDGYLFRLVEQGIDEAIIIEPSSGSWSLAQAQEIENQLANMLQVTHYFPRSIKHLTQTNHHFSKVRSRSIEHMFQQVSVMFSEFTFTTKLNLRELGLFSPWLNSENKYIQQFYTAPYLILNYKIIIHGKILATWGEISLIQTSAGIFRVLPRYLIGHAILSNNN